MAADSTDANPDPTPERPVQRPSLRYYLWYSVGGSLPERYWPWVFLDTTSRTWALREFARFFAVLIPLFALYIGLLPAPIGLRWLTGITFGLGVLLILSLNVIVLNDRRAVRAGYPAGYVFDLRTQRSAENRTAAVRARNERSAERRARRNA